MKRLINDQIVNCIDVGCDDLEKAKANRERVANKVSTEWWEEMEERLSKIPLANPLPKDIPHEPRLQVTDLRYYPWMCFAGVEFDRVLGRDAIIHMREEKFVLLD